MPKPTDRAIAQAFREYFAGPLLMSSGSLLDAKGRIERRAREIDAAAPADANLVASTPMETTALVSSETAPGEKQGPAGAQAPVAWRLTMRSGVSGRNDNVIGDFTDKTTAFFVGAALKDADSYDAPEYRSFDVEPTPPPAASEDAEDAARYRFLRSKVSWMRPGDEKPWTTPSGIYLVATMVSAVYGDCDEQVDAAIDAARGSEG